MPDANQPESSSEQPAPPGAATGGEVEDDREINGVQTVDAESLWDPSSPVAQSQTPSRGSLAATRRRDQVLWMWPILVIAVMALLGQLLGSFGVLLGGVGTIGVLVLFIGSGFVQRRTHLIFGAVACTAIAVVYVGHSYGLLGGGPAQQPVQPSAEVKTASGKTLTLADLRGGAGRGAVLNGVTLDDAELSRAELDGIVAPGASMRNASLDQAHFAGADLHGADLRLARLHKADLRGANLAGANFFGADLTGACLLGADLSGATLDSANFSGAVVDERTVDAKSRAVARNWPASVSAACS